MAEVAEKRVEKIIQFPGQGVQQTILSKDDLEQIIQDAVAKAAQPKKKKARPTDSMYTTDGRKKPSAADPVRTKEDFQRMVDYLGSHGAEKYRLRNKTIFILGCSVALRCSDILKLKTYDVYFGTGQVRTHLEVFDKKTRKRSVCKLSQMAVDALVEYRKEQHFDYSVDEYLFRSKKKGGPLGVRSYYSILTEAGKACGLDAHISTHTMRKTYAMAALLSAEGTTEEANTLQLLQMKLNHSDARITMRYCKAAQDKMDEMSDRVSDWFE